MEKNEFAFTVIFQGWFEFDVFHKENIKKEIIADINHTR